MRASRVARRTSRARPLFVAVLASITLVCLCAAGLHAATGRRQQPDALESMKGEATDVLRFFKKEANEEKKTAALKQKQVKKTPVHHKASSLGSSMNSDVLELEKEVGRDQLLSGRDKATAKKLAKQRVLLRHRLEEIGHRREALQDIVQLEQHGAQSLTPHERTKMKANLHQLILDARAQMGREKLHSPESLAESDATETAVNNGKVSHKVRHFREAAHDAERVRVSKALQRAEKKLDSLEQIQRDVDAAKQRVAVLEHQSQVERKKALKDFNLAGSMLRQADPTPIHKAVRFGSAHEKRAAVLASLQKAGGKKSSQMAQNAVGELRQSRKDSHNAAKARRLVSRLQAVLSTKEHDISQAKLTVSLLRSRLSQLCGTPKNTHTKLAASKPQVQQLAIAHEVAAKAANKSSLRTLALAKRLGMLLGGKEHKATAAAIKQAKAQLQQANAQKQALVHELSEDASQEATATKQANLLASHLTQEKTALQAMRGM